MPRKLKSHDGNPYDSVRSMWEIAYVSQFLRLFHVKLGLKNLSTQLLEDSLRDAGSYLLPDVCARLLRYLTGSNNILITNFESSFKELLNKRNLSAQNPLQGNGGSWQKLNPEEKLGVLKWLVDHVYQEKEEDLVDFLDDNYDADDLRGICAGQDAFNNVYWYLDDLRLYRENSWKKPSKKEWECVCSSLTDWLSLLKQFRKTTNLQERQLHTYLNFQLFPLIKGQLQAQLEGDPPDCDLENRRLLDRERADLRTKINGSQEEMLEKSINCNGSTGATTLVVNGNATPTPNSELLHCRNSPPDSKDLADGFLTIKSEDGLCQDPENGRTKSDGSFPTKNGSLPAVSSGFSTSGGCFPNKNGNEGNSLNNKSGGFSANSGALPNNCTNSESVSSGASTELKPMVNVGLCTNKNENMCSSGNCTSCGSQSQESGSVNSVSSINGAGIGSLSNPGSIMQQSRENTQDGSLQSFGDHPSDSSVSSNKENMPAVTPVITPPEVAPVSAITSLLGANNPAIVTTVAPSNNVNCGGSGPSVCLSGGVGPNQSSVQQPLPSNMMAGKNCSTVAMETQYMQQQSQIFVFSTALANKSAEAVLSGQFPSIIAYHCSQPGTKRFLEKHPLKIHQFNRQSPAAWLNNLAQMKQGNRQLKGIAAPLNHFQGVPPQQGNVPPCHGHGMINQPYPGGVAPCTGPCGLHGGCGSAGGGAGPPAAPWMGPGGPGGAGPHQMPTGAPYRGPLNNWPQHQMPQGHIQGGPMSGSVPPGGSQRFPVCGSQPRMPHPNCPPHQQQPGAGQGGAPPMGMGGHYPPPPGGEYMNPSGSPHLGPHSSLQGIKIPDENLTPQQRQHREEQLAMIRKMHHMLFPEHHPDHPHGSGGNPPHMYPHHPDQPPHGHPGHPPHHQHGMMCMPPGVSGGHQRTPGGPPGSEMCQPGQVDMMYGQQPQQQQQQCLTHMDHEHHPDSHMFTNSPHFMQHQQQQQQQQQQQLEWQKMQQQQQQQAQSQFFDDPQRKGKPAASGTATPQQMPPQQPGTPVPVGTPQPPQSLESPSPTMGMSPGPRLQGPPPPYHPSRGGPMPSSHPASPASLSLSSPHMTSGMASPADHNRQFSHPTTPGAPVGPRMPHPSPSGGSGGGGGGSGGASTPSAASAPSGNNGGTNSMHSTPLNSPKQANGNSGGLVRTPTTPNPISTPTNVIPANSIVSTMLTSPSPTGGPGSVGSRKHGPTTPLAGNQSGHVATPNPDTDFKPLTPSPAAGSDTSLFGGSRPLQQSTPTGGSAPATPTASTASNGGSSGASTSLPNIKTEPGSAGPATPSTPASTAPVPGGMSGAPPLVGKEPSLMPVPSPQQIQYLNAFDGQELTIQKQPNTSLRETDLLSPALTGPGLDYPGSSVPSSQPPFLSPESTSSPYMNPGSVGAGSGPPSRGTVPGSLDGSIGPSPGAPGHFPNPGSAGGVAGMPRDPQQRYSSPGYDVPHRFMSPNATSSPLDGSMQRFQSMEGTGPMPRYMGPQGPEFPSPQMDMVRFPGGPNTPDSMQRFRGPSPHGPPELAPVRYMGHHPMSQDMLHHPQPQFSPPESMPPQQAGQQQYSSPNHLPGNFDMGSHSHLHNLQKMTPPFELGGKMGEVMSPLGVGSGMPSTHPQAGMGGRSSRPQTSPQQPGGSASSSQRLTHFDPIASMTEHVSNDGSNSGGPQQPIVPPPGSTQTHQSMMTTTMNMTSMQVSPAATPSSGTMVNFHTSMQSMQGMHQQSMGATGVPTPPQQQQQQQQPQPQQVSQQQQQQQYGMGPQTVNNTYVNATMSIQQMNIQNVIGSTYNPSMPQMNPGAAMMHPHHHPHSPHHQPPMGAAGGAHTVSSASTPGHPIMHSSVSPKSGARSAANIPPAGSLGTFPGHPMGAQRMPQMGGPPTVPGMMPRAPGAPGYNTANIQVKASAPNTIQYLPARPQNSSVMGSRQPSLDFLQRYASPLTNLDSKVPTHNLQYFPKNGASPQQQQQPPGQMSSMQGMMPASQRSMMDPMRGPVPGMMGPQQPGHVFSAGIPPGGDPSMYCRPSRPGTSSPLMGLGSLGGPPQSGPISGMMANRQMPLSPSDIPPDTSQPLPSSMGHSFNYKQSAAFYGPTTADPNYAAQFHNFQQQLYATNTRSSQQNNMAASSPGFFGTK